MDLTDDEKKVAADYAEIAKTKIANGVASGLMDCLACGESVKIVRKNGNAWNALCSCGWSAAGIGNFSEHLN